MNANKERTPKSRAAPAPAVGTAGIPADDPRLTGQTQAETPKNLRTAGNPGAEVVDALSGAEHSLKAWETARLERWNALIAVSLALAEIRNSRQYRPEFGSFAAYYRAKWRYHRTSVYALIASARIFRHLAANSRVVKPDRESQLKPLIALTPEQAQAAWERAVERAGGQRITGRLVQAAVQDLHLAPRASMAAIRARRKKRIQHRRLMK